MDFEEALRKVILESEDTAIGISEKASYEYRYLSDFLKKESKLYVSQMQRLYDALSDRDRKKWLSLILDN